MSLEDVIREVQKEIDEEFNWDLEPETELDFES
jgi:hypothetical protein